MNILLFPCHSILEHDEYKMFHEMGHQVFSIGSYFDPTKPQDPIRPPIDDKDKPAFRSAWNRRMEAREVPKTFWNRFANKLLKWPWHDSLEKFPEELLDWADVIIIYHLDHIFLKHWRAIRRKKVIWRTIGQCLEGNEKRMKRFRDDGVLIVRYSTMERNIPNYIGEDAVIGFYKDPDEYHGWTGHEERVMLCGQSLLGRSDHVSYPALDHISKPFKRVIVGRGNHDLPDWIGKDLNYLELKEQIRVNRCGVYAGTKPASYTLFLMEMMMMGMPVVALGKKHCNYLGYDLYELPQIIDHGVNGFCSDDEDELIACIRKLMEDGDYARQIGNAGRQTAINRWGKARIRQEWTDFFAKLDAG
jgi:hypothetical protein